MPEDYEVRPCAPWATGADVCEPCASANIDLAVLTRELGVASDILYRATAMQFDGLCTETVWPCCKADLCDYLGEQHPWYPTIVEGQWYNVGPDSGCVTWDCGQRRPTVDLGAWYPVRSVTEVKINGSAIASSAYRLEGNRWLRRIDGSLWPTAQNLNAADDNVSGTWTVTFTHGTPPPQAGIDAAADLGCQLALLCKPVDGAECRLPIRATRVTRQGVTYNVADVVSLVQSGATGLYKVDLFIHNTNPYGLHVPPTVYTPDFKPAPRSIT